MTTQQLYGPLKVGKKFVSPYHTTRTGYVCRDRLLRLLNGLFRYVGLHILPMDTTSRLQATIILWPYGMLRPGSASSTF
jgi:hypothetical protein